MSPSSRRESILSAHSGWRIAGCFRYSRSNVNAAFFLTNDLEVLQLVTFSKRVYGEMRSRYTSAPRASPISRPPTFAIACNAIQFHNSLFTSTRSHRIELTTRLIKSFRSLSRSVTARYPICFSLYRGDVNNDNDSKWPKVRG